MFVCIFENKITTYFFCSSNTFRHSTFLFLIFYYGISWYHIIKCFYIYIIALNIKLVNYQKIFWFTRKVSEGETRIVVLVSKESQCDKSTKIVYDWPAQINNRDSNGAKWRRECTPHPRPCYSAPLPVPG